MIPAVVLLCLVAGSIAMPVNTDYYPKSQEYGGRRINGGFIGINNNGFESSILGLNGGNSAAAAAAAAATAATAASGLNSAGLLGGNSAAAAAASSAQRTSFNGLQGHSEHHLIGSYYGPFVHHVQPVQFPAVQQFPGLGGSAAAAAAAAAAGQQSAAAAAAAAAGQNAAAAAAAAAGRNAAAAAAAAAGQNAAAAAASASGANFGSHLGIRGSQFAGQIGGQFVQPSPYYPNVVGQNSGSAASAAAASNNAAAAAAASASANGFNGGIIGGSTGVIGSRFVPGKKY
ncbi:antifreeze protein Maxi-like isoform X2 [Crassostrea angulata]|uniref:antifreeze protein Maxi-like isoform X2 n=1 Tax=Magallana angulata TaxID=2784310 RepID=UPI0022B09FBE|nr:antifreeze protein Maxi-like isoform X2 [Crassostrea angulata]